MDENFEYLNIDESRYLGQVEDAFQGYDRDIVRVSTSFDTYLEDRSRLLKIEDYRKIDQAFREGRKRVARRRFAVLQGRIPSGSEVAREELCRGIQVRLNFRPGAQALRLELGEVKALMKPLRCCREIEYPNFGLI